jgi:hypothetical protein
MYEDGNFFDGTFLLITPKDGSPASGAPPERHKTLALGTCFEATLEWAKSRSQVTNLRAASLPTYSIRRR